MAETRSYDCSISYYIDQPRGSQNWSLNRPHHDHDPAAGPRCREELGGAARKIVRARARMVASRDPARRVASIAVSSRAAGSRARRARHGSAVPGPTCIARRENMADVADSLSFPLRRASSAAHGRPEATDRSAATPANRRRVQMCTHSAPDWPPRLPPRPTRARQALLGASARECASAAAEEQSTDCAPRPARRARRWRVWGVDGSVNVAAPQISA